jgi:ACS family hexuronate transporter-like MFS transporter
MQVSSSKPTNVRWGVFALACGTSWLLYLHRYAFALIKPEIAEQWDLGKDELGLLDSVFSIFYTVFQVPLGIAADAWGVRLVLTGLILVWCIGLGMHAWAGSSTQMWYARAVFGFGQSAGYAALSRISRQWFPPKIRTTLQGFVGVTAGRVGGLSANLLFGFLLLGVFHLDWRTATYLFVALGLANAVVFFAALRNLPNEQPLVNDAEAALISGADDVGANTLASSPRMSVKQMLRSLTPRGLVNLIALNVQSVLSTFADNIYSNWIPLFLAEVHQLKFKEMGIYSSLPLLGGAIAGVVGGLLNDACISWTGNRRWSRSGVAAVGKTLAAVTLFTALIWYDQPYTFCALLFFVKFFGDWSLTTSWGVVTDIGGQATASVYAFNNTVAGIGSICAPIVFGLLAEHYGWQRVFVTTAVTYLLCALSWLVINCTIPLVKDTRPNGATNR